jgi:hypothetical protein
MRLLLTTVHPVNRSLCFLARHLLNTSPATLHLMLAANEHPATAASLQSSDKPFSLRRRANRGPPTQLPSDASRPALAKHPFANLSGILTFEQFYLTVTTSICATLC